MNTIQRVSLLFVLLMGVACQREPASLPATTMPVVSTPTQELASPTPAAPQETGAAPSSTPSAEATAPATVFDAAWDDRTVFEVNLQPAQQDDLNQLPGASIHHMALTIGEDLTVVNGRQEVRYTNQEDEPLDEIFFHLYPNLLGGNITVSNVSLDGTPVNAIDGGTVLEVPLATPLASGAQTVIAMDFTTIVPQETGRNYGIFAAVDDVLALAHFYPMVAAYDEEGWDIAPAPEQGDVTYGDASFYLVQVTAPADQTIVGTGVAIARDAAAETQTVTLAAGPARDFYLALSDRYAVVSRDLDGIRINSYAPANLQAGAEAALDAAAVALQSFGERYGPYPYTEFDIVSTPTLALGVEYPGIIANTVRMYDLANDSFRTPNTILLESTTAHEVAHQWFYNLVGNDQVEEPWLDEALTQYATYQYYLDRYGEQPADEFYDSFLARWGAVQNEPIPIGQPVEAYEGNEYSAIVYGRGPIFVNELAQTMGDDAFRSFMQNYNMEYRWDIATTEEFKALAESHCNCDLTPLFEEWIFSDIN